MRQPSMIKSFILLFIWTALTLLFFSGTLLQLSIQNKADRQADSQQVYLKLSTTNLQKIFHLEIPLLAMNVQAGNNSDDAKDKSNQTLFNYLLSIYSPEYNDWLKLELPAFVFADSSEVSNKNYADFHDNVVESYPDDSFFAAEKNKVAQAPAGDNNNNNQAAIPVTTGNRNVVFIYHTHNRESFLPELSTDVLSRAYDPTTNITLVGSELGKELKRLGIGNVVSTKDYWPELPDYYLSYKYSLETVTTALQQNRDYKYVFDIHRDANKRENTTRKINGVEYAAIYIVIGKGNKNYQKNLEFAMEIHESLERLYPGLSKGVVEKEQTSGTNGEYNQSVSPYSLTIEMGGAYNTLEEEYRSARAFAEAIADVYWQAEKVNASFQ